jgi:uncharacterized integral membrane protein
MMQRFTQFFKDDTGQLSMMRLTQFLVVFVILLVFLITNVMTAAIEVKKGVAPTWIVDFPTQCVYILGIVIGGKVLQAGAEVAQAILGKKDPPGGGSAIAVSVGINSAPSSGSVAPHE